MSRRDHGTRIRKAFGRNGLLVSTSAVHLTNDACFALLYPLLPFIASDLDLSLTEVGLLKATFSGSSSVFQIPTAAIGARFGEQLVLLIGNAWVGAGLVGMGLAGSFLALLVLAAFAGLGGNAQHPLGASLISRTSEGPRLATAMGTLNFAGDLGKLIGPFVAGIVAVNFGWQAALAAVGIPTLVLSVSLLLTRREPGMVSELPSSDKRRPSAPLRDRRFQLVLAAGGLDNATRGAALTFLPFVLADKGLDAATISVLYGVIFAAGAAGKFGCGWISDRWNLLAVIFLTELVTAGALLSMLGASVWMVVPLAIAFGFALNGTSSALNVAVARFISSERRASGYGIYFTVALVSSACAPLAYGLLGDASGLNTVFVVMAALTLAVIPVIMPLRSPLSTLR
jgi:FSR family fosmidomycin resistance protein-like MFS transporter